MELPKLKKENLSKELREVVGDNDLEFDSLVDPTDVMNLAVNLEEYLEGKAETVKSFVESRQKQHEYQTKARKSEQA
mgnify:CR=1 FL=1|tara:strand:- start:82 stop:312 length:231 start_codon:yes stop_codon:yes gene_type:complete